MRRISYFIWLTLFIAVNLPVSAAAQSETAPEIKSKAVVLVDASTGQVLFEKNMNDKMAPASVTKIMTALLALERGKMNGTITMSYDAVFSVGRDTSHIALDYEEMLTLEQALYALAIASANDAANGIAEYIGGSMEDFAAAMTKRAKEVGALNTNFTNAHGLPGEEHYTTAYDIARIMAAAIQIPEFVNIFGAASYEMSPTNKQPETRIFYRKNSLLTGEYKYDGVIAEKTGWTPEAGYTYVSAAQRNGRTLIAVVMKSPNEAARWEDTAALFDYGFNEFASVSFIAAELSKEGYSIEGAGGVRIDADLIPAGGFHCLVLKTLTKEDIEVKYILSTDGASGKMRGTAIISLKTSSSMYAELGKVDVQVRFNVGGDAVPANVSEEQAETKKNGSILSLILQIIGAFSVILVLAGVFLYIRKKRIMHKKRTRRASQPKNYR